RQALRTRRLVSAPAPTRTGDLQVRSLRTTHTLPHAARKSLRFPRRWNRAHGQNRDGSGRRYAPDIRAQRPSPKSPRRGLARRTIPRGAASERWDPCARRATPGGVADTPRTTRDVTPADVADVVADPRRATVTFVDDGEPAIVPVRARREGDRWHFAAAAPALDDREVVLPLDDGDWWFELRGVSVRGVARRDSDGWYTVEPRRVLAWSYESLRLRRV